MRFVKFWQRPEMTINPTAVRVPVFYGHSAAVHLETREKLSLSQAIALLERAPGLKIFVEAAEFPPTPVQDAAGQMSCVWVGFVKIFLIREDWISGSWRIMSGKGLN